MIFILRIIQGSFIILLLGLLVAYLFFKEEVPIKKIEEWVKQAQKTATKAAGLEEKLSKLLEQAQQADHPAVAIAFLREGLELAKERIAKPNLTEPNKYSTLIADFSIEIGKNYNILAQYEKAKKYLQDALVIYQKLENIKGQGNVLTELGILYHHLDQDDRALELFQRALKNYVQLKQEAEQAQILTHLGVVYSRRGQDQYALEKFGHALDIYLKKQRIDGKNDILIQQGILHRNRQRYTESLKTFEEALGNTKTPKEQANLLMQEGISYYENKQFEKAIPILERAEFFFGSSQSKDLVKKTATIIQRGRVNVAQGQYEEAIKQFTKSLHLSQEIKDRQGEWESLIHFGFTYDKLKRYDEARAKFAQAIEVDAQDGFFFVQERLNTYDKIIQLLEAQPAYGTQAIKVFESKQKRLWLSFLGQPISNLSPTLLQEEEKLTHHLEKIDDQFAKAYSQQPVNSDQIQILTHQLKQWQSKQMDFEKSLIQQAPDYYFLKYAKPMTLEALQGQLLPNEAILIYHVMKDHSLLWAIHREQFFKDKLSFKEKTATQESMNAVTRRLSSKKLSQWLAKIKPQKIYIVPPQAGCDMPLPRYQNYALTYLPFASSLEYLRTRQSTPHKSCRDILVNHDLLIPNNMVISDLSSDACLIEMTSKPSQTQASVCHLVATLLYAGVSTVSVKPWLLGPHAPKKVHVAPITFGIQ